MNIILGVSGAVIQQRAPTDLLNYDCINDPKGDMTEICTNMCYGVNCRNFPSRLYWDKPDGPTKQSRANNAGCKSSNRCSQNPYGSNFQCDEYPFRSVQPPVDLPVNRCVPAAQNRAQSNVLKQFYYSQGSYKGVGLGGSPGSFNLAFANYGNIKYCGFQPDCTNDGNEYNKNGAVPDTPPSKRGDAAQEHPDNVYVTQKGKTIHVPVGANAGDRVWTPLSYDEDMEFDQDVVVGPANQTSV